MVAPPTTVYLLLSPVLAGAALLFVALGLRESGTRRRMLLVGAVPAASMAGAYLCMGLEIATVQTAGREQSVMRFFGYTGAVVALVYLLKQSIDLGRRRTLVLLATIMATFWLSFVSWLFTGAIESVITFGSLALFGYAASQLFGPIARAAEGVTGERRLFFAKLRNLFVLCYGTLVLLSVISEQVLGLADSFVGALGAGYVDAILMCGIAVLAFTSVEVFVDDGAAVPGQATTGETPRAGEATDD